MKPELIKIALDRVLGESYTDRYKQLLALEIAGELDEIIKPAQNPDEVRYGIAEINDGFAEVNYLNYLGTDNLKLGNNIKLTFDGETRELKSAEVIK